MKLFLLLILILLSTMKYFVYSGESWMHPANDSSLIQIDLLDINFMAYTNSLTLDDINKHFSEDSDGYLDQSDKSYLLSKFEGKSTISTFIETTPLQFNLNLENISFNLSVTDLAYFKFDIPYDAAKLLLLGNEKEKHYNFDDAKFQSLYYRKYMLGLSSYAKNIPLLTFIPKNSRIGFSGAFVQGYSFVDANIKSSNLYTNDIAQISGFINIDALTAFSPDFGINHEYANTEYISNIGLLNEPSGTGFSFDVYWESQKKDSSINFKIGIYDIGSISWSKNTGKYISNSTYNFSDIFNKAQLDSLEKTFYFNSAENNFSSMMPSNLKFELVTSLNTYLDLPYNMDGYFSYYQAINTALYNTYIPKLSLLIDNQFIEDAPSLLVGIRNNIFNQIEVPIYVSYKSIFFNATVGIRDISRYFNSSADGISIISFFSFIL